MDTSLIPISLGALTLAGSVVTALVTLRRIKADSAATIQSSADRFRDQLVDAVAHLRGANDHLVRENDALRDEVKDLNEEVRQLRRRLGRVQGSE